MNKYELLQDDTVNILNHKLYRIRALQDFRDTKKGDLGGYIENEDNLSQYGNCWVFGDARVFNNAIVSGSARVNGKSKVSGNAAVSGNAIVSGNARVNGKSKVSGNAAVSGNAIVSGNVVVCGNVMISNNVLISNNAEISDNARVSGNAIVSGNAVVSGNAIVSGNAVVSGNAYIKSNNDFTIIEGFGTENRNTTFFRCNDDSIKVNCGCFIGTIEEFRDQVKETRDGYIEQEYLVIADLMEKHFKNNKKIERGNNMIKTHIHGEIQNMFTIENIKTHLVVQEHVQEQEDKPGYLYFANYPAVFKSKDEAEYYLLRFDLSESDMKEIEIKPTDISFFDNGAILVEFNDQEKHVCDSKN